MNKYKSKKITIDWYTFYSIQESKYYEENKSKISRVHPKRTLQNSFEKNGKKYRAIEYEADFELYDETVIDVKGLATSEAKLKRKMFLYRYELN